MNNYYRREIEILSKLEKLVHYKSTVHTNPIEIGRSDLEFLLIWSKTSLYSIDPEVRILCVEEEHYHALVKILNSGGIWSFLERTLKTSLEAYDYGKRFLKKYNSWFLNEKTKEK